MRYVGRVFLVLVASSFIGFTHLVIDVWKSYKSEGIKWFLLDQLFHCLVLAAIAYVWCLDHSWTISGICSLKLLAVLISVLICWKPANIFIKLTLIHYSVNMPEEKEDARFNAGALIGTVERWLILIFVYLGRYEALGLLIAAKSIIRFSESQTNKTEYVLAGTLMSILIAVLCGLFIVGINQIISFLS